jgi:hypothetical protein
MKIRLSVYRILYCFVLLGLCSCSNTPTQYQPQAPVDLRITFKPSLLTTLISAVRLHIYYPGTGETREELPSIAGGTIRDTLVLTPGNNVEFHLQALSAQDTVLYEGYDTLDVVIGGSTVVTILMEPVVSMLRPSPMYQSVVVASEVTVGIDVYNISQLYGAAFRLYFDDNVLSIKSVSPGALLGESILFTPNVQEGYVAVGISRLPTATGLVGESGRLAAIVFNTVAGGESTLEFDPTRLKLTDQDGEPIPEAAKIVLETGVIVVGNTPGAN